jgi:hypothetical protein
MLLQRTLPTPEKVLPIAPGNTGLGYNGRYIADRSDIKSGVENRHALRSNLYSIKGGYFLRRPLPNQSWPVAPQYKTEYGVPAPE